MDVKLVSYTRNIILRLYNDGQPNKAALAEIRTATTLNSPRAQSLWPVMLAYLPEGMLSRSGQPTKEETAIYTAVRLYALHQQSIERCVYGSSRDIQGNSDRTLSDVVAKIRQRSGLSTKEEIAVYTAVQRYIVFQQEIDKSQPQSDEEGDALAKLPQGSPLFAALSRLRADPKKQVALDRRIQPILASTDFSTITHALSHLVGMLKSRTNLIHVDYAQLAQDLYQVQLGYAQANRVRLRWGQQYFYIASNQEQTEGKNN